jgi:uncharacterized membrane protein
MREHAVSLCRELPVNISEKQRLCSVIAGGVLIAMGILDFNKSSLRKAIRLTSGALLLMRAVSGYCPATALKESIEKRNRSGEEELETERY